MAMSGLEGGDAEKIWHWPLHYYMAIRREFLRANNIAPASGSSHDGAGEKVVRRDTVRGVEVVHYERT